jgi:hypothetical protein
MYYQEYFGNRSSAQLSTGDVKDKMEQFYVVIYNKKYPDYAMMLFDYPIKTMSQYKKYSDSLRIHPPKLYSKLL